MNEELLKLRREQFNLRMARATGQAAKPDQFGKVRRNIARLKTVLGEQQRAGALRSKPAPKVVSNERANIGDSGISAQEPTDKKSAKKLARAVTGKVVPARMRRPSQYPVERLVKYETYGKYIRRTTKLLAHDERRSREGLIWSPSKSAVLCHAAKSWRLVQC